MYYRRIELVASALRNLRAESLAVAFLVVEYEVLDASADVVRLDALDLRPDQRSGQEGVLQRARQHEQQHERRHKQQHEHIPRRWFRRCGRSTARAPGSRPGPGEEETVSTSRGAATGALSAPASRWCP